MSISLIWITPDAEKHIAFCARVSNPANQDNPDYEKLLRYCIKNAHHSVFEMASACIEIKCSRTIARQILRHRSFVFQEFSQRYAEVPEGYPNLEPRLQDPKNRQNSVEGVERHVWDQWDWHLNNVYSEARNAYQFAIDNGIAKECARAFLPEGLTMSTMYMSGTIRSWMHYLQVRLGNGTQKEHVEVAEGVLAVLRNHIPTIINATGLTDGKTL